jgi:saccharopine dehydrogenase (NAD+, L-lysine-forming)
LDDRQRIRGCQDLDDRQSAPRVRRGNCGGQRAGDSMGVTIGIRREDKNQWERRVPLVPADVGDLRDHHDVEFHVQTSPIRVFTDVEYESVGARIVPDLAAADIVLAVKEIPVAELLPHRTYLFFSHTVKGQDRNMPMLRHLLDTGSTLIDYEKIADEQNRRLIFFSLHAGYAGAIESLVALGERLAAEGRTTPLLDVRHAYEYAGLDDAKAHLRQIGARIAQHEPDAGERPLVIGIAGYGNVAKGCAEILSCLPVQKITPAELPAAAAETAASRGPLLLVEFRESDMVVPRSAEAQFVLQDYYQHPDTYRSVFADHLPHLDLLLNTIYWTPAYPRLVTRKWVRENYGPGLSPRLKVIGDISCDIEGSIEITLKSPTPEAPCFVYDPETDTVQDGVIGLGPVVMAVDNLPCELPRESSSHFSSVLRDMVPSLIQADFTASFESLHLPPHLKKAVICHRGELTPAFRYLQGHLDKAAR